MSTIRRAKEKDIGRMMELLVQVNMVHHVARPDLFNGPTTKYTEKELADLLSDESRPIFVLTDENDVLKGYCFCVITEHKNDRLLADIKTLYIDDLCVDEACRGEHIGEKLYHYTKDYAKEIGCYNVTLNVWAGNDGAKAFYERMGMQPQKYGMEEIL